MNKIDKAELIIQLSRLKSILQDELDKHGSVCPHCKNTGLNIVEGEYESWVYTCSICASSGTVITYTQNRLNIDAEQSMELLANKLGYEYKSIQLDTYVPKLLIVNGEEYIEYGIGKEKKFIQEGLVYESSIGFVIAPPKVGKTTFTYLLSRAIANGESFMGHKNNKQCNTLYILVEGTLSGISQAFPMPKNMFVVEDKMFDWYDHKDAIIKFIKDNNIEVVVLDSLYRLTDMDISKSTHLKPFLKELDQLATQLKCTFIIPHHTNRMELTENHQNKVAGSSDIVRAGEYFIYLDKPKKSEEEENTDLELSDEEINKKPLTMIVSKHDYRYGKAGFNKYTVEIDVYNKCLEYDRFKLNAKKANKEDRLEDLIEYAQHIVAVMDEPINKGTLAEMLSIEYKELTKSSIEKRYGKEILDWLKSNKLIAKSNGHNYKYVGKAPVIDLTSHQIAVTVEQD